jgi:AraC-like DNA-binding protein
MYQQYGQGDPLFMTLYGAAAMLSLTACFYLLFRRANAIAPDVSSSIRLRRWTAAFFACMTLSHLWYFPLAFLTSTEDVLLSYLVGAILDFMTLIPLAIVIMFVMLQDRRRPLWPIAMMMVPPIIVLAVCIVNRSISLFPIFYTYYILLGIGLIIYMVRALRQYGRWLRDNYADLEHKEVRQSFVVLAIILMVFGLYSFAFKDQIYKYIVQVNDFLMIGYLLWRVETLSDLSISQPQDLPTEADDLLAIHTDTTKDEDNGLSLLSFRNNIEPLLKQYCEESQLYLQHDMTLSRLAKEIGINRFYLSQYFSNLGMNYNAYINNLRINHFVNLYREAVAAHCPVIAQQLALESGYQSYRTFSDAFKRKMGQSVTAWMRAENEGLG